MPNQATPPAHKMSRLQQSPVVPAKSAGFVPSTPTAECICERPCSAFYCSACSGYFFGRLSIQCLEHRNVVFLLDTPRCVHCQAGLYMIRPVAMDKQTVREINAASQTLLPLN